MGEHSNETLKIVLNYRLLDDDFFKLVAEDIAVCQEILRTILGDNDIVVLEVKAQVTEVSVRREIRLDTKCRLGNGTLCNIEVQKSNNNDDIRRTRFHTSMLTVNSTPKGKKFADIPNVIAIYISEYDVLENGQRLTTVRRCQRLGDVYLPVVDGELIIFANTIFTDEEIHNSDNLSDIDRLLMLFNRKDLFYDDKFPNLSKRVRYFKENKEKVDAMCNAVEEYGKRCAKEAEERGEKRGVEIGKELGVTQGKNEEKYANACKMLQKGYALDDIIDITGLTKEEIETL